jgi:DNA-binding transcriptional LysR family regulator
MVFVRIRTASREQPLCPLGIVPPLRYGVAGLAAPRGISKNRVPGFCMLPGGVTARMPPPRMELSDEREDVRSPLDADAIACMAMIRDFDGIVGFIKTVEAGNFSAAAKDLNITPSAVSKQIARLEARLGVMLFSRNSRGLRLTEAGQEYYDGCAKGLAQFLLAEEQISTFRSQPSGVLNVTAPQGFGSMHIAPHIPDFAKQHPGIVVDLSFSYIENLEPNSRRDIIISSVDPPDESMMVRPLLSIERIACATPAYLAEHGRPATIADLRNHNCLIFTGASRSEHWTFRTKDGLVKAQVSGNLRTNSHEVLHTAVTRGMGIAQIPSYVVGDALERGTLVALFNDRKEGPVRTTHDTMNIYYPQEKDRLPKIRAFVDFLIRLFRKPDAKR